MAEAFAMVTFSTRFGWTPDQIRALDKKDKMIYFSIIKGMGEAEKETNSSQNFGAIKR